MRIGFEAKRLFSNATGLGNYARTLVWDLLEHGSMAAESKNEALDLVLFTPKATRTSQTARFFEHERVEICCGPGAFGALWRVWGQGQSAREEKLDLYHGLSNELPLDFSSAANSRAGSKGLLLGNSIPLVVSIHDLLFKRFSKDYSLLDRAIYDFKFKYACRRASLIIAISEATRQDLEDIYKVPPERIRVVQQSCAQPFYKRADADMKNAVRRKYQLPQDFILSVGSIIERKNLLGALRALEIMPAEIPMVVVGRGNSAYAREIYKYVQEQKLESRVFFRPAVTFEDLPVVYQLCSCVVYVSLGEGFGIPVLEGLASGVPVVTSRVSAMPEAGGDAALLVNPSNPEEIAAALTLFLENREARLSAVAKGLAHAQKFSSEQVTQQILAVYRSLL